MEIDTKKIFNNVATNYYAEDPERMKDELDRWVKGEPRVYTQQDMENLSKHLFSVTKLLAGSYFSQRIEDVIGYDNLRPGAFDEARISLAILDAAEEIVLLTEAREMLRVKRESGGVEFDHSSDKFMHISRLLFQELRTEIKQAFPSPKP